MVEQIERELIVDAPPEEVWDVVTSSGWLAADVDFDLAPGGDASFRSQEWSKQGWVEVALAPGEEASSGCLIFWWSADDEPASRVELTLEPTDGEGTRLRVVESRPLEVLDIVGMPMPGTGESHGPLMLALA